MWTIYVYKNKYHFSRNLNTVRAIGDMHGNVVDRPRVMARYARRCLYRRNNKNPLQYLHLAWRQFYFEYCLWASAWRLRLMDWYLNFLYLIGRAPASARTLMQDIMKQDEQLLH